MVSTDVDAFSVSLFQDWQGPTSWPLETQTGRLAKSSKVVLFHFRGQPKFAWC